MRKVLEEGYHIHISGTVLKLHSLFYSPCGKGKGGFRSLDSKELMHWYASNTNDTQVRKLEQDVPGNGSCANIGQHLSGANFPVQVYSDRTKWSAGAQKWSQGVGRTNRGGSRPPRTPKYSLTLFGNSPSEDCTWPIVLHQTWRIPFPGKRLRHFHASLNVYNLTNFLFCGPPLPMDHICDY